MIRMSPSRDPANTHTPVGSQFREFHHVRRDYVWAVRGLKAKETVNGCPLERVVSCLPGVRTEAERCHLIQLCRRRPYLIKYRHNFTANIAACRLMRRLWERGVDFQDI